jgi:hypothetical protein
VVNLLNCFIPDTYGVGSGIIVNPYGDESTQWDIIIYEKNILRPFIYEMSGGLSPGRDHIRSNRSQVKIDQIKTY